MSHISTIKTKNRLPFVRAACPACQLAFYENRNRFRDFSGTKPCQHAIGVAGDADAYEIGVIVDAAGYCTLLFDAWKNGRGLLDRAGVNACKLLQYASAYEAVHNAGQNNYALTDLSFQGDCLLVTLEERETLSL